MRTNEPGHAASCSADPSWVQSWVHSSLNVGKLLLTFLVERIELWLRLKRKAIARFAPKVSQMNISGDVDK